MHRTASPDEFFVTSVENVAEELSPKVRRGAGVTLGVWTDLKKQLCTFLLQINREAPNYLFSVEKVFHCSLQKR